MDIRRIILVLSVVFLLVPAGCAGGERADTGDTEPEGSSLPEIRDADTPADEEIKATGPTGAGTREGIEGETGEELISGAMITFMEECVACHYISTGKMPTKETATIDLAGVGNKYDYDGFREHFQNHPPGAETPYAVRFTGEQLDDMIRFLMTLTEEPQEDMAAEEPDAEE